ncbi:flavodoxin [Dorea sp. D27]|jgi:flavodoxin|uniref:flavodoxin n=1 Tax=Dorea sp. D27 TaxID=658665 RepID=UPI0006739790|nr:flavodoxin [Dorea sp. D27]KMZ54604.1 putative flavodoxin [Dorea sp. D27]
MKTLIAYFSRKGNNYVGGNIVNLPVGNTEVAAKKIAALTGGDLFEIKTVRSYSEDYTACTEEAQQEFRTAARPELNGAIPDLSGYDVICLGYPNWWGTAPMAVFTFLESADVSGKIIRPFCTHEGSGMGHSESDIKKACSTATVEKGLAIRGGNIKNADRDIEQWVSSIEGKE